MDAPWNNFNREKYFNEIRSIQPFSINTCLLEDLLINKDTVFVQKVIRDAEPPVFCKALSGASGKTRIIFFSAMGQSSLYLYKEDMEFIGTLPENEIIDAQREVCNIINKLIEQEEINPQE